MPSEPIAEADVDLAALDDEELRRRVALLEDDLAGLEFAHRGAGSRQNAEIDGCLGHVRIPPRLLQCVCAVCDYCSSVAAGESQFYDERGPALRGQIVPARDIERCGERPN